MKYYVSIKVLNRKTSVTAPTGIAAFDINGLTIHRYFQLPIEHDDALKYVQLSGNLLKLMREEMRDVELIIIDEILMVSNTTLLYINQGLMEIFDTFEQTDDPPYVKLSSTEVEKRLGSMSSANIWTDLFSYDELTINMGQQKDRAYGDLLSQLRVGMITAENIKILESRQFDIGSLKTANRVHLLWQYIKSLPPDTVCLLSTQEIVLIAEDSVDCRDHRLKKKAKKMIDEEEKGDRSSAGLAKIITIKVGSKIMLVVTTVTKSVRKTVEYINSITVCLESGKEFEIERIDSQDLSLHNAVMDVGQAIFSSCQTYVALSRLPLRPLKNSIDSGQNTDLILNKYLCPINIGRRYGTLSGLLKLVQMMRRM
ncbi:ATP-dependent DNA helicase pif1-like [Diachasmimorpha longicaudata]|uniref:ATP-dependent DNA helicase pif1-like n=1 Tax=Diachasmimorpha longicaudata TaxID=58733 RepID=UPI0030B8F635